MNHVQMQNRDPRDSLLLDISNEMVRIYKEQFGRGPTKARTDWSGPDALICTLRESFTAAEKNLAAMGELDRLRDTRMFFQYATEDQFIRVIQERVGRKVVGYVSGIDAKRDISAEVFYFEPRELREDDASQEKAARIANAKVGGTYVSRKGGERSDREAEAAPVRKDDPYSPAPPRPTPENPPGMGLEPYSPSKTERRGPDR